MGRGAYKNAAILGVKMALSAVKLNELRHRASDFGLYL